MGRRKTGILAVLKPVSLGLSGCSLLSWNKSRSVLILKFTLLEREIVV